MVKIYSTNVCPYCKLAKDYFIKNKIEFTEYNVQEDEKALSEMVKKSGQMGVPVIEINDQIIVGFDREAIDSALASK